MIERFLEYLIKYQDALYVIGGFAAGSIATYFKFYPILKEKENKQIKFDSNIFKQSDAVLSEKQINELIGDLESNHSYRSNQDNRLNSFLSFFEDTSNIYEYKELNCHITTLKKDLEKLQYFYSTHFFIFPDYQTSDNTKFCMYPEGNVDRNWNGKQESKSNYEEKEEKLLELCIKTKESYKKYRLEIRKILKV
ncbi:hypothetical protein [Arcobacter defluvii]|uniref:Uncharacterized protein n=1 Tax=Arcobacter defluvii TaxID=873191 RepID=A0AAE7BE70_9BACT|nr:hypothetical protein [Arcobacter defluvii]QKF77458.1 hypothetical protein ADFLV_1432 [Arcobacter defluvii]RXI32083.1 hypothetical protein CP964_08880 [Arcobacter defluvii]